MSFVEWNYLIFARKMGKQINQYVRMIIIKI